MENMCSKVWIYGHIGYVHQFHLDITLIYVKYLVNCKYQTSSKSLLIGCYIVARSGNKKHRETHNCFADRKKDVHKTIITLNFSYLLGLNSFAVCLSYLVMSRLCLPNYTFTRYVLQVFIQIIPWQCVFICKFQDQDCRFQIYVKLKKLRYEIVCTNL